MATLTVKVMSRLEPKEWARYFPGSEHQWGDCRFVFDTGTRHYDWLVVYNDLPSKAGERFPVNHEILACPRTNTLLVTHEPPNIKVYGEHYTQQFGHVLTSQPEWALPHSSRIYSQTAMIWYYGRSPEKLRNRQWLAQSRPAKSRPISTVCAVKQHRTREHVKRDRFVEMLQTRLQSLDVYGRGIRPITDKSESIDDYYYHIAIENYFGMHHWTEKLADPILGLALPIYAGCPNISDYFPENSYVSINLDDYEASIETVMQVLQDDSYTARLPALLEARRLLLEKYNFFAVVSAIAAQRHQHGTGPREPLFSRRAALTRSPPGILKYLTRKAVVKYRL